LSGEEWDREEVIELDADEFHEECMMINPGEEFRYAFEASFLLEFGVHFHEEGKIYFPVPEESVSRGEGVFRPMIAKKYCFMWTNSESSSPLRLEMRYATRKAGAGPR
jgi:hypothetical protein